MKDTSTRWPPLSFLFPFLFDQLNSFAGEVTRVARVKRRRREVGGQARCRGRRRYWKDLTDSVNEMAGNLTAHGARYSLASYTGVANGDLRPS